jgi:hypothetical protein
MGSPTKGLSFLGRTPYCIGAIFFYIFAPTLKNHHVPIWPLSSSDPITIMLSVCPHLAKLTSKRRDGPVGPPQVTERTWRVLQATPLTQIRRTLRQCATCPRGKHKTTAVFEPYPILYSGWHAHDSHTMAWEDGCKMKYNEPRSRTWRSPTVILPNGAYGKASSSCWTTRSSATRRPPNRPASHLRSPADMVGVWSSLVAIFNCVVCVRQCKMRKYHCSLKLNFVTSLVKFGNQTRVGPIQLLTRPSVV